jgi:ketosteroid isomerase-like protein
MTRTVTVDKDIKALELANKGFYAAFESLDIRKMDAVWVQKDHVKCVHPGWEIRIGWPDVRDSWVLIFNHTSQIKFSICLLDLSVQGDMAWTICNESISTKDKGKWVDGRIISTNLFERHDDDWYLIHHHGSPLLSIDTQVDSPS